MQMDEENREGESFKEKGDVGAQPMANEMSGDRDGASLSHVGAPGVLGPRPERPCPLRQIGGGRLTAVANVRPSGGDDTRGIPPRPPICLSSKAASGAA